jgi:hypothetical protein
MTTNEKAAQWWAERLFVEEKREAFRAALLTRLDAAPWCGLHVDYDPEDELLQALHDAGIKCSGHFFSADGLLPGKTSLYNRSTGLYAKQGYAAPLLHIDTGEPPTPVYDDE